MGKPPPSKSKKPKLCNYVRNAFLIFGCCIIETTSINYIEYKLDIILRAKHGHNGGENI